MSWPILLTCSSRRALTGLVCRDAVFGVKSSLVVDLEEIHDDERAKALGFKSAPYYLLERDWKLLSVEEAEVEKKKSLAAYYASINGQA